VFTQSEKLQKTDAARYNAVTLAFLGDAVYALYVRDKLVRSNSGKPADLQRAASGVLSARGQSAFLERVLPMLTQEEEDVFKRGRNAKKATKSKHASAAEYARSTGFEAVLGYLYFTGNDERIKELLSKADDRDFATIAEAKIFKPTH
jgi:ribonuclease-3 family protein